MPELKKQSKEIECIRCHQFKQYDQFCKDRNKKEGIKHICRSCQKIRLEEYKAKWAFERAIGEIEVPTEKECKICNQVKPVSEFSKRSGRKDGIDNICKICKSKNRIKMISRWKKERADKKNIPKIKMCSKCLKFLPISHFNNSINYKNGYDGICKKCQAELTREYKRRWTEERNTAISSIDRKYCPSCNRVLPVSSFYGNDYTKDGLRAYCIECVLQNAELKAEKWSVERLQNPETPKEKSCNICKRLLPISEFHKNRRYKDGLCASCINCQKARQKEYNQKWEESRSDNDEILVAKECNVCHEILPVSSFSHNKRHKDGLFGTCKNCIEKRIQNYITKWKKEEPIKNIDLAKFDGLFPSFEKECISCHRILPVTFFYRNIRKKDGQSSICKDCKKKIVRKSRKRAKKKSKRKIPKEKLCISCQRVLPSINFIKDIYHKDGLATYCKECNRKREREYRNRPDVKKRLKEKKRIYDSRPDVLKKKREYSLNYSRRPDVKIRRKKYNNEYRKRPGVRERLIQYNKDYRKRKSVESKTL